jgi:hypothetical protein
VKKSRLYPSTPIPAGINCATHIIRDEPYYPGELLMKEVVSIVSREGWHPSDLRQLCHFYYSILQSHSKRKDGEWHIPGKFIDLTPFNIIKGKDGIHAFDQEWEAAEYLPLYYVFFRGILYSMANILFFSRPAPGVSRNLMELVTGLVNMIMPFDESHLSDCLEKENSNFSSVRRGAILTFNEGDICIRGPYDLEKKLEEREKDMDHVLNKMSHIAGILDITRQELDKAQSRITGIQEELDLLKMENAHLQKNNDWYLRTYEKRGILGVLKEKLSHMLH